MLVGALGPSRTTPVMEDVLSSGFDGRSACLATVVGSTGTDGLAVELTVAGPDGGTSQADKRPVAKPNTAPAKAMATAPRTRLSIMAVPGAVNRCTSRTTLRRVGSTDDGNCTSVVSWSMIRPGGRCGL